MSNLEEINKIKKELTEKGLWLFRVPFSTQKEFKEFSRREWSDDRGMAFNYLWKFFKGECSSGHEELHAKIGYLAEELDKIKEVLSKEEEPKKRESLAQRNKRFKEEQKNVKIK